MQPKNQLKVQYIGIFEEIDSFYWPKMHFLKEGQKSRAMPEKKTFFFVDPFPYSVIVAPQKIIPL